MSAITQRIRDVSRSAAGELARVSRSAAGELARVWARPVAGQVLRVVVGYVVLVEVLMQLVFGRIDLPLVEVSWLEVGLRGRPIPREVFVFGAIVGTLYGLIGMGIILVYRANRVLNFAQAQLGAVPAILGLLLMVKEGWSYWLALPIAVVGGGLLGGVVEVGVVRRFQRSSRLVLTVATVGVGLFLLILEVLVKEGIAGTLLVTDRVRTPFDGLLQVQYGVVALQGDHFLTILVAVGVLAALAAFFRYTNIGIAVRAAAENRPAAALLGIPVNRVSTVVWVLAGTLSGIGVFLRAPLTGIPLSGFIGPFLLLYGLTAAVLARMDRLPMALVGGMFVGIADTVAVFSTRRASLAAASMLVVIVGALLLQRRHLSRTGAGEATSWDNVREPRPVPLELRHLREVVWGRRVLIALVVVVAVGLPWIVNDVRVPFATVGLAYAMVGVSLVILTGWAGQISLGQFAISGIGAAVAGGLVANHGWDFFGAVITAGVVGAVVALVIGLPALRIQGLFLAVTTLAFAFTVEDFVLQREYFPWLLPADAAFVEPPVLYGRWDLTSTTEVLGATITPAAKLYLLTLLFLVASIGIARSARRYRSGRVFIAVRDSERVSQAFGISPALTRLNAFALSGFIAGLAGAVFVFSQGSVDSGTFTPERSIELFVVTVLGGIGSVSGAILGAIFLQSFSIFGLREIPVWGELISLLGTSVGVLLILYFLPGGIAEGVLRLRDRWLRRVAARRGIVVPSLIADVRTGSQDDFARIKDGHLPRRPADDDDDAHEAAQPQPAVVTGGGS
ncbi:MAG TPA: ABC transporter permease [Nitriliruptorales bacterium]